MKKLGNPVNRFIETVQDLFIRSRRIRRRGRRYQRSCIPSALQILEPRQLLSGLPLQFVDPHPVTGNQFGHTVVTLTNGNVVISSPNDNAGGTAAGAVYLFNGQTGTLISTLIGSHANDDLGSGGITALMNGNFVVDSPKWNGGIGAVTFGNGITGVTGMVSSSNSLVGSTAGDMVGLLGVTTLTNGNYVVDSDNWNSEFGAVTFGNATTGVTGTVGSNNSLIGSTAGDQVGSPVGALGNGITALLNGNYVVDSYKWNGDAGAVTFGSGATGVTGTISSSNSLVGSTAGDGVGFNVTQLTNGNYVVNSPLWNGKIGAVTFGSGTTGVTGTISSSNSLVGSTANDEVGVGATTALTNGNYVVDSDFWNGLEGAATFGNGTTGLRGTISSNNSLIGRAGDEVGGGGITALTNGNYVVDSDNWHTVGAVTFGNGTTGITGMVSSSNSLVGSVTGDNIGARGNSALGDITVLTNGNYVVDSDSWNGDSGAVTFGNGTTGVSGTVSSSNSLVGSSAGGDQVGVGGITALTNGNYVVDSYYWGGVGAVTFGNGTTGVTGTVGFSNSLVGTTFNDEVGLDGITVLTNGNYVVDSAIWNGKIGAVTFGNGTTGITGAVSSNNSLVGSTAGDEVGYSGVVAGITALTNGNYVVDSYVWDGRVGAVTFGNGITGITGTVSSSNSLVGSTAGDLVGDGGITALASGNYVVASSFWNGSLGAATFGYGTAGITGPISSSNSLLGHIASDFGGVIADNAQNAFYVSFPGDGSGTVYGCSSISGFFGLPALPNSEVLLSFDVGPDGTLYGLTTLGNLYSFPTGGGSWTQIDSNVLKIALAGNGDLVDLHTDGTLREFTVVGGGNSYVQIDGGVTGFATAGNGDVVDLHAGGGLYEFTAYRSGASVLIASGVTQFAIAGNGDVVVRTVTNIVEEFTAYRSANSFVQIDGGVTGFAIAGNGDIVDLHPSGNLYELTAYRNAPAVLIASAVTQFAIAGDGDVVELSTSRVLDEFIAYRSAASFVQLDGGVTRFAIAGNGDVVDLHASGGLYEFTTYQSAAYHVQLDSGVTSLTVAGNGDVIDLRSTGRLYEFTAYRSGSSLVQLDAGVTSIAIAGNGDVVDLHSGGGLYEFKAYRNGGNYVQLDSGVAVLAIAGNGDVVELHASGGLYEFTAYRSAANSMQVDGGVNAFAIAGNGLVEDLHFSGNRYIQTSFRGSVSQLISQFM